MILKQKILVPLTMLALFISLSRTMAAVEEEFIKAFDLSATGHLSLKNINGNVMITARDQLGVKVRYVKRARSQSDLDQMRVEIDATTERIHIETRYERSGRLWGDNSGSVDYMIEVPRRAQIEKVELVNGKLEISGVEGLVHASLINGDLKAHKLGGGVILENINGSLEVSLNRLRAEERVKLSSVNGSLEVILPRGVDADIDAKTVQGRIRNDFGIEVKPGRYIGQSMRGSIGRGGARIELGNVNGSIHVRKD